MEEKKSDRQLGTAPVGRLLLRLSAPMVLAQIVNMLYNVVDRIYIGHIPEIGRLALTGVGLCFPLITIITAFYVLIAQGGAPLEEEDPALHLVWNALLREIRVQLMGPVQMEILQKLIESRFGLRVMF